MLRKIFPLDTVKEAFPQFDNYEYVDKGGCGIVYKINKKGKDYALKLLHPGLRKERVIREKEAYINLEHPNIVKLYDSNTKTISGYDTTYLIFDFITGKTIKDYLKDRYKFSNIEIINLSIQIVEALNVIHGNKMIHRDIKPGNIMINSEGKPIILDLGIAKHIDRTKLTALGDFIGTELYSSPEQIRGEEITYRSDFFSLGITLYEMATNEKPFSNKEQILNGDVEPALLKNSNISPELNDIIMKLLQKNPYERYPNAKRLLLDLEKTKLSILFLEDKDNCKYFNNSCFFIHQGGNSYKNILSVINNTEIDGILFSPRNITKNSLLKVVNNYKEKLGSIVIDPQTYLYQLKKHSPKNFTQTYQSYCLMSLESETDLKYLSNTKNQVNLIKNIIELNMELDTSFIILPYFYHENAQFLNLNFCILDHSKNIINDYSINKPLFCGLFINEYELIDEKLFNNLIKNIIESGHQSFYLIINTCNNTEYYEKYLKNKIRFFQILKDNEIESLLGHVDFEAFGISCFGLVSFASGQSISLQNMNFPKLRLNEKIKIPKEARRKKLFDFNLLNFIFITDELDKILANKKLSEQMICDCIYCNQYKSYDPGIHGSLEDYLESSNLYNHYFYNMIKTSNNFKTLPHKERLDAYLNRIQNAINLFSILKEENIEITYSNNYINRLKTQFKVFSSFKE